MNPVAMAVIILSLTGAFLWSANQRWGLLKVGGPTPESRFTNLGARLKTVWTYAFFQKRMRYYFAAGLAHNLIFAGFVMLLLRSLILWGRGFDPTFNFWIFGPSGRSRRQIYAFFKDIFATLVLVGVRVFVYYRVIKPAEAHDALGGGAAHPRDHRDDDARGHAVRRRRAGAEPQAASASAARAARTSGARRPRS